MAYQGGLPVWKRVNLADVTSKWSHERLKRNKICILFISDISDYFIQNIMRIYGTISFTIFFFFYQSFPPLGHEQFISPFCWNAIDSISVPNLDVSNTIFYVEKENRLQEWPSVFRDLIIISSSATFN